MVDGFFHADPHPGNLMWQPEEELLYFLDLGMVGEVPPEVREGDPAVAVFAGPDGLAVIPDVVARAAALLRPGGAFAVEHDDTHAEAVAALLRAHGEFVDVAEHADLNGHPRYATARRR